VLNAHIEVEISHSVSECQSDKSGEFAIFFTKLVAMEMTLEILEKEVQINHLHTKRVHSVKRLRKSVQRILRQLFSEKSLTKEKNEEINASKIYSPIGKLASGLNYNHETHALSYTFKSGA